MKAAVRLELLELDQDGTARKAQQSLNLRSDVVGAGNCSRGTEKTLGLFKANRGTIPLRYNPRTCDHISYISYLLQLLREKDELTISTSRLYTDFPAQDHNILTARLLCSVDAKRSHGVLDFLLSKGQYISQAQAAIVAHGELDEGHGQPILVLDLDNAVAILGKVMLEFYLIAFERMVRGKTADVG